MSSSKRSIDQENEGGDTNNNNNNNSSVKKVKVDNERDVTPPPPPPPSSSSPPPPPPPPKEETHSTVVVDNRRPMLEVDDDGDEEDDPAAFINKSKKNIHRARRDCPYLDTVNRTVLDFDFEKSCSVSFVNLNIYACLVCGKKFQGKSPGSHAHYHCMQSNHHVFINLHNQKIYCLPDDYEVVDSSLDDIKYLVNPTFTKEQIALFDKSTKYSRALDGTSYLPGFIGLNNIKKNSYINVVIQSLARVSMIRNYFINQDNLKNCKSALVNNFGELLRKIWNPRNFKGHVSPHELIRVVQSASTRFTISNESDPLEFLQWFLNSLSYDLNVMNGVDTKQQNSNSNIIQQAFSGEIQLTVTPPPKSSGSETTTAAAATTKPTSKTSREKEPTIVNFPLKNLDLKDYLSPDVLKTCKSTKYNLLSNIKHEGEPDAGNYTVYLHNKGFDKWFEIQDLTVKETLPQLVAVSEAYLLLSAKTKTLASVFNFEVTILKISIDQ
ncbi:SAP DNA-binding domain-containing protein [Heterostelium album PN500]|uniref:SAP DNA-binding domain-containing protein n=1 Tax=Heterostelium pallidum (strain ATCC 26659 / Pp 5 / PN500) TaxID=670386 RepID=D3AWJ9_HETP5|nr:SAP DNA-binding domain-containing protein [Heterostelium album PN500]EFA86672.1 SAP DNA-binding domain-containing protein [Heterostelium album PN500]|eukprot:XP_020438776.1 SAP DNA-binding domain-containing protein [Heterostelium album PN500]